MICKKCKTKNIIKALFCKNCGNAFSQQERDRAYNRTIFGIIKNFRKLKAYATLSFITSKLWFKALTLVAILLYGFLQVTVTGRQMKIQPSEYYNVQYNTASKEYYITSEYSEIGLNLYLPMEAENISVIKTDLAGNIDNCTNYTSDDNITITYDDSTKYCVSADFIDGKSQSVQLYLIHK